MDDVLRNAKKEESVILRGGNCDGHDMQDEVTLIRDHENSVIYAVYGVSWSDQFGDEFGGVYDMSYCFSFKEVDMIAAIAQLRVMRGENQVYLEVPNPEADPTAVEPRDSGLTADDPIDQS